MVTPQVESWWRAYWDPESEVLILTLASAILAALGIALILMGAMPASAGPKPEPPAAAAALDTQALDTQALNTAAPRIRAQLRPVVRKPAVRKPSALGRSLPLSLDIPAIGVHTKLMSLGLERDGTVEVPPAESSAPAGWYRNLSSPGEAGPAVILGHVDSARDGPAVFYRLSGLRRGDRIAVHRKDGSTAFFAVRSVGRYPKKSFPTEAVYGAQPGAVLRLVTCGGSYDALRHRYRDNVVVFATLSDTRTPHRPRS